MSPKSGFAISIRIHLRASSVSFYQDDRRASPRKGSQPRDGGPTYPPIQKAVRPGFVGNNEFYTFGGNYRTIWKLITDRNCPNGGVESGSREET